MYEVKNGFTQEAKVKILDWSSLSLGDACNILETRSPVCVSSTNPLDPPPSPASSPGTLRSGQRSEAGQLGVVRGRAVVAACRVWGVGRDQHGSWPRRRLSALSNVTS